MSESNFDGSHRWAHRLLQCILCLWQIFREGIPRRRKLHCLMGRLGARVQMNPGIDPYDERALVISYTPIVKAQHRTLWHATVSSIEHEGNHKRIRTDLVKKPASKLMPASGSVADLMCTWPVDSGYCCKNICYYWNLCSTKLLVYIRWNSQHKSICVLSRRSMGLRNIYRVTDLRRAEPYDRNIYAGLTLTKAQST